MENENKISGIIPFMYSMGLYREIVARVKNGSLLSEDGTVIRYDFLIDREYLDRHFKINGNENR